MDESEDYYVSLMQLPEEEVVGIAKEAGDQRQAISLLVRAIAAKLAVGENGKVTEEPS